MTTKRQRSYLLRMALVNAGIALLIVLVFRRATQFSLLGWLADYGVALVFANAVGAPMAWIMPRVSRRVSVLSAVQRWTVLLTIMAVTAVAGSLCAIGLLVAVGVLPADSFSSWFRDSARASIFLALTFGVIITLYETTKARLEATTLALRTKERDEAEARRIAAEAQLASLEARVQPHFLFNTLNSIAALIPQDPRGAERMIGQLSSLMRASLDAGATPLVMLAQELRNVRHYLDIEQVRFGDRLRYSIDTPADLDRTPVPALSLQTLAENAVKYAVSVRREGGRITIRAAAADGQVQLTVEDDGPGFDVAALPEQHGLALLRDRLALTFAASAALQIDSRPGCTRVSLTVPR